MNKTTLRVAQIVSPWISVPPKDYGGTERVVYDLTEELVKRNYAVSLFATGDSHTRAKLHFFWKKALVRMHIPWKDDDKAKYHIEQSFKKAIKPINKDIINPLYNYDVIHFHLSSSADIIVFALASRSPIPVICTLHSRFPFDRRPKHIGEKDKYYLQWVQDLPMIGISERAREDALETTKAALNFIKIIPHGLPESEFLKFDSEEKITRDSLVWVGRIIQDKGVHIALEVAISLKMKIIFGGIIPEVPEEVAYFNEKINPLIEKYPDLITFIGKVNPERRAKLLQQGLVFLNPIQWEEPFGLVMIEAMAQGCPCISFPRGAANELIQPGINGEFAANAEEMAQKVKVVIDSIDRDKLVAWTKSFYSISSMTDNYLNAYQIVMNDFSRKVSFSKRQKVYAKIKKLQKKYLLSK